MEMMISILYDFSTQDPWIFYVVEKCVSACINGAYKTFMQGQLGWAPMMPDEIWARVDESKVIV